jgi:hypothetical protein
LSVADLNEIKSKLDTLIELDLPFETEGIKIAFQKVKGQSDPQAYEIWVRSQRDRFLRLASQKEVGIDTSLFTEEVENGGLSITEMQKAINETCMRGDLILSPVNDREHALRSFALTFMEHIDALRKDPREQRNYWKRLVSNVQPKAK